LPEIFYHIKNPKLSIINSKFSIKKISSLSLAGQTAIVNQAILLASGLSFFAPSRKKFFQ